jgi:hypothetical protein
VGQMGQEKCTGEIKNTHKIQLENLKRMGTLGDLVLDEMLK